MSNLGHPTFVGPISRFSCQPHVPAGSLQPLLRRMLPTAIAIVGAATITAAPPAHADESNFIPDLQARGVPIIGFNAPQVMTGRGYTICAQLRNGESPETAAGEFGLYFWGPTLVEVAQQDLCPDTLHSTSH
ncbi:DUF732 domain-containing protein [Mycobacterium helveticum]|uniref:DUF732 domain-containing protein n=1 Tax=Mycobacterium helveticum TaxID=2592811 RepID=A0A557XZC9_9MYCO|nr:DUF732 domain-containing protein [Mycobacterium helveticum]TVS88780.1 DUF732 domain-containing protein [Mycobacterium helveticum]TVS91607.1 DUF732 domain-containing protein [Mycobacterium helveticum]